jgi:hypothetical protein
MKSGIEMIEEVLAKIDLLDRRFTIVEQMMKELINRTNGLAPPLCDVSEKAENPVGPAPSMKITGPSPGLQAKPKQIGDPPGSNKTGAITSKVMGKIKNSDGRAVSGVNVKVFDENNSMVKGTKTNRAGDWMCFLPPGRYSASYFLKDMINANVNFNVVPGQTLIRVAQPNL